MLYISGIFARKKRQTTFWKYQKGNFVIIFRIGFLEKLDCMNAATYFKDQRQFSSRFSSVTFRGMPCTFYSNQKLLHLHGFISKQNKKIIDILHLMINNDNYFKNEK